MAENKPAILKITQPYAQEFIPKLCCSALPTPMMELYNPEALHMSYLTLLETCESAFQSITVRIIVLKWLQAKKITEHLHPHRSLPIRWPNLKWKQEDSQ